MELEILKTLNEEQIKKLEEDKEKFEHALSLFENWYRYQKHLPQHFSKTMLSLYLRASKMNLEKLKSKFEAYCYAISTHPIFISNRLATIEDDVESLDHIQIVPLPVLTSEAYRISVIRISDAEKCDMLQTLRCSALLADYRVHNETFLAGDILIFDVVLLKSKHIAKVFCSLLLNFLKMAIKIYPVRIKKILIVHSHPIVEKGLDLCKSILPEKIANRFHTINDGLDLHKHVPTKYLPSDYGGDQKSVDVLISCWKKVLLNNKEFYRKTNEAIPLGPLPKNMIKYYEDMGLDGSFRKLEID